jgi:hypothetical protein
MADRGLDPNRYRMDGPALDVSKGERRSFPSKRHLVKRFLKGPTPEAWILRVVKACGGFAVVLAELLWIQCCCDGSDTVKLNRNAMARKCGVSRNTVALATRKLVRAGILEVKHGGRGHCSIVRFVEKPKV